MFSGPKFLAYVQKPSVYYLRKMIPDEQRMEMLEDMSKRTRRALISHTNPVYKTANEMLLKK